MYANNIFCLHLPYVNKTLLLLSPRVYQFNIKLMNQLNYITRIIEQ